MRPYWKVTYRDGTVQKQYNEDGTENLYSSINQNKLYSFSVVINIVEYSVNLHKQIIISGETLLFENILQGIPRLIYFRRNKISYPTNERTTQHCIGIQTTYEGINHKVLCKIQEETQEIFIEVK